MHTTNLRKDELMKLIIHAGRMKTGTTALQEHFHLNRNLLKENGWFYPNIKGSQDPLNVDWSSKSQLESALLSCEHLQFADNTIFNNIQDFSGAKDVEIVFCIREPRSWLISLYKQELATHKTSLHWVEWLILKSNSFTLHSKDYFNSLSIPFRIVKYDDNVVSWWENFLDVNFVPYINDYEPGQRVNQSVSWKGAEVYRLFNDVCSEVPNINYPEWAYQEVRNLFPNDFKTPDLYGKEYNIPQNIKTLLDKEEDWFNSYFNIEQ